MKCALPREAPPTPPQRTTPARKGARYGAGAGPPRRHRPHPGHTGRKTPAARPRGRAARGGTAPDTRRISQGIRATGTVPSPYPHTRAHSTRTAGLDSPQEEGSRRGESARPRTPLATGSPRTAGGEHLMAICAHECQPAVPAYDLPHPSPAAPTARTPATGNPHPSPCSLAQRHNNGRTRLPTQNTPLISDAGRSTRGHQGAGTQRRRRRPPTRGRGQGL